MIYKRLNPSEALKEIVKEYWVYENENPEIKREKIIPDGYSEIIIHYKSPYRIHINGNWEMQSVILFSNQISSYFFLENTGSSGMIGIKLHPVSFYELFGGEMSSYTDHVVPLEEIIPKKSIHLIEALNREIGIPTKILSIDRWITSQARVISKMRIAVDRILETNGLIDIQKLAIEGGQSLRSFERKFKKVVGVSPKFYSRIIRFSKIFHKIRSEDHSWVSLALQSGYFDQAHFIKNFKEFTGEEPSKYGFNEKNLANFFLIK
ncbi:MAG: AraC family transcriptional regulator [Bacteroidota bacterium]